MMMKKHNTIDIYQREEWPDALRGVLIYSENEYGCASHIAIKSLLGDTEPSGRILTHLINQMVFNQTKDYEQVGWAYYFYEDILIVNINKWPQTPIMPLDEAQATWIHCYPPVRDLLSFLYEKYGSMGWLSYMTSTTLHDSLNTDIFRIHDPKETIAFWHSSQKMIPLPATGKKVKGDLFFTPPAWMFPHFANAMGFTNCLTLFSGHDPESGDIDEVAALTLFRWANQVSGNKQTKHAFNRALKKTKAQVAETLSLRKDLEALLESAEQKTEAPNVLWG
jgi:hypothetical protein